MFKKNISMKYLGEQCLHQPVKDIEVVTDEIRELGEQMIDVMHKHDGVGLAGPQVGVPLRIVVLDVPPPKEGAMLSPGERELLPLMPVVLINPRIVSFSPVTDIYEEGCLSVPKIYAPVERPVSVILKTRLLNGPEMQIDCGGFLARAIQHELDHLDGVVFVQRVQGEAYEEILPQLKKIIKKYGTKGYKINRLVK